METLKLTAATILLMSALVVAGMIGYSRLPQSSECQATYQLNDNFEPSTWRPVGWKVEDGFPRSDCELPTDKLVYEDGTWEWR